MTPTPGRIAQLLKNPGTRAALADKFLNQKQMAQRTAARAAKAGNAPIVPGGTLTPSVLDAQTQSAVQAQFGGADQAKTAKLGAVQQYGKDLPGYFDGYLAQLAQHAQNIGSNNTAANDANTKLIGSVGQLAPPSGQSAQNTTDAQNAGSVRQALLASFAGQQNSTGANAQNYADTQAHVVGPGQKLSGIAQNQRNQNAVRDELGALKGQEGAYGTRYRSDAIANDFKNVLAMSVASGKQTSQASTDAYRQAQIDLRRGVDPVTGKALPKKDPVNQYGYTDSQWAAMTPAERQKNMVEVQNQLHPPKPAKGKGPKWAPGAQQGTAQDKIGSAQGFAAQLKDAGYSRGDAAKQLLSGTKGAPIFRTVKGKSGPKQVRALNPDGTQATTSSWPSFDPVFASAALDMAFDGHLSAYNVSRLHARGIQIKALGLPTKIDTSNAPAYKPVSGKL